MMGDVPHIVRATYLHNYTLKVEFSDGYVMKYDVQPSLWGEIGSPLLELDLFRKFRIEHGALVWPNGFDTCPDYLRYYYQSAGIESHV